MRVVLTLERLDPLVEIRGHALAVEGEAKGVVGAGRERHLDGRYRVVAAVGEAGLREPPDVDIAEPAAGRARASLDGLERQADHFRGESETHDHTVGEPAGQLQRFRPFGGEIHGHPARRALHAQGAPLALDRLPRGEPAEGDHGLLETGERRGRSTDRVQSAVARAQAQHSPPPRQLVHARDGAGRHHQVTGERVGDERAQPNAPGV
jgi:hypothetical protein